MGVAILPAHLPDCREASVLPISKTLAGSRQADECDRASQALHDVSDADPDAAAFHFHPRMVLRVVEIVRQIVTLYLHATDLLC